MVTERLASWNHEGIVQITPVDVIRVTPAGDIATKTQRQLAAPPRDDRQENTGQPDNQRHLHSRCAGDEDPDDADFSAVLQTLTFRCRQ